MEPVRANMKYCLIVRALPRLPITEPLQRSDDQNRDAIEIAQASRLPPDIVNRLGVLTRRLQAS